MPPPRNPFTAVAASRIRGWVPSAFPRGQSGIDYDPPPGAPGLFGPDSVTWCVHADSPGMLSGGLCAWMLQTLHPLAPAGVWDHSSFREDLVGRLDDGVAPRACARAGDDPAILHAMPGAARVRAADRR